MNNWKTYKDTMLADLIDKSRIGVITDVDGTISRIVDVPSEAEVTAENRAALQKLIGKLPLVAFVSGRAVRDLRPRVDLDGGVYVGNHGLERWCDGGVEVAEEVSAYRPQMEAAKSAVEKHEIDGMWVEDKGVTLTVHYRHVSQPASFAAEFRPTVARIASANGLKLSDGNMIFELKPPIDAHKGTAFRDLVQEFDLDAAVFLGDDVTDVDAMRMAGRLREDGVCYCASIGVLGAETPPLVTTEADMSASDVDDVSSFFEWLTSVVDNAS